MGNHLDTPRTGVEAAQLDQHCPARIARERSRGHIRYVNNGMMRIGALMHSFSGAVNNGASVLEIRETLLQTALYSGIPTGMASFRVAEAALAKLEKEDKI
ncbi:hypothetical protein H2248_005345 [Termitomyces sp. 'cryptogamus']|nr:hypothetical protein H2248_005345 [Termitomyces sp. 'cryptogamus']